MLDGLADITKISLISLLAFMMIFDDASRRGGFFACAFGIFGQACFSTIRPEEGFSLPLYHTHATIAISPTHGGRQCRHTFKRHATDTPLTFIISPGFCGIELSDCFSWFADFLAALLYRQAQEAELSLTHASPATAARRNLRCYSQRFPRLSSCAAFLCDSPFDIMNDFHWWLFANRQLLAVNYAAVMK